MYNKSEKKSWAVLKKKNYKSHSGLLKLKFITNYTPRGRGFLKSKDL